MKKYLITRLFQVSSISILGLLILSFIPLPHEAQAANGVFYAGVGDGFVYARSTAASCSSSDWNSIHDLTTGHGAVATGTNPSVSAGIFCQAPTLGLSIYKSLFSFDTSTLPDDAIILDAKLYVYVTTKRNNLNDGNDFFSIVSGMQSSPTTLAKSDYSKVGDNATNPTEGSNRLDLTNVLINSYSVWTLNQNGTSWISKTGYTQLGIREGHDISNIPPALGGNQGNYLGFHYSEQSGTIQDPYLDITYTTSSGDVTAPTVSITSPSNGASVSNVIDVVADASDDTSVVGVQFKLDGINLGNEDTVTPYSVTWDTTTTVNGSHTLTALARDPSGNSTISNSVTVTTNNTVVDSPPTATIISPTAGSTVSGTITVNANASDDVGVSGVQFQVDGSNIGTEDTTSPYSYSWNSIGFPNGNHTLNAIARDTSGKTSVSPGITVNLNNAVNCNYTSTQALFGQTLAPSNYVRSQAHEQRLTQAASSIVLVDTNGNPSPTGKAGFLWIGNSNARKFMVNYLAPSIKKETLQHRGYSTIITAAQNGVTARRWADPNDTAWTQVDSLTSSNGLSKAQVEAVYMLLTNDAPNTNGGVNKSHVQSILGILQARGYTNIKLVVLSGLNYTGYSGLSSLANEPFPHDDSIRYGTFAEDTDLLPIVFTDLWADGINPNPLTAAPANPLSGSPGADALSYACNDFEGDGVHENLVTADRMARNIKARWYNDEVFRNWIWK